MTDDELIAELQNRAGADGRSDTWVLLTEAADRIAQLTDRTDEPSDGKLDTLYIATAKEARGTNVHWHHAGLRAVWRAGRAASEPDKPREGETA